MPFSRDTARLTELKEARHNRRKTESLLPNPSETNQAHAGRPAHTQYSAPHARL